MIADPPSDSGVCHLIVTEVSVMPEMSRGPRGEDGASEDSKNFPFSVFPRNIIVLIRAIFHLNYRTFP